jgi:hypothetical protein
MNAIEHKAVSALLHREEPKEENGPFLLVYRDGKISKSELYDWDDDNKEFYGNIIHHIPLNNLKGWISINELQRAL